MPRANIPRGVEPNQAINSRFYLRDTRSPYQRFWQFCQRPVNLGAVCSATAGVVYLYPALVDCALVLALAVGIVALRIKPRLLLKLPDRYQGVDSNDPRPGSETEFYRAHGMFFLGNDRKTRTELYQSEEDVRTHFLVIGGTGAGKTEAMLGMAANLLLWGSGFSYTDGKGDSALWTKAFALLRACGREDDLYVINYMTGSTTVDPDALIEHRLTNTFNPFALGSADSLTQLLVSLMPEAGGDSAPWKQKAIGLLTALMMILHSMRERGLDEQGRPFVLDVSALRTYVTLDALIDLYLRARYRVDGFEVTATAFGALKGYLESVPGFQDPERLWGQAERTPLTAEVIRERRYPTQPEQQAYVQHGYLQNQFTRIFGQLADVYGYIYRVQLGEIDFADVVLNRRVLIVMLPALEKSPDELSSLGKIIIASLKTMLAVGLGSRLEGTHREVIDNKPIQAPAPFLSINDEYGYYAVKGFAVVPAQARSIGFAVCFGGQDTPSFGKESKEEAAAVFGNTLTKIAMRIEDAGESFELFQKTAGEVLVTQTGGFARHENAWLSGYYHDTHSATVEKRNRIDLLDIREQRPGQAHIFYGSTMIRAELFFAAVPPVRAYRLNRFIQVQPQAADAIRDNQRSMSPDAIREGIQQILRMPNGLLDSLHIPSNADLAALRRERSNVRFANGIIAYLLDT